MDGVWISFEAIRALFCLTASLSSEQWKAKSLAEKR